MGAQSSALNTNQHVCLVKKKKGVKTAPIEISCPQISSHIIKVGLPIDKDMPPSTSSLDVHLRMPTVLYAPIEITVPLSTDMEAIKLTAFPNHTT